MIEHEKEILEYLQEAYEDKGLFPSGTGGWIKTFRISIDLQIDEKILNNSCRFLHGRGFIETIPPRPNFYTSQPLIKITEEGIEHLRKLKAKSIDAWHFKKKGEENASLAKNWEDRGVYPHVRLEKLEENEKTIKAKVYGRSDFLYSQWRELSKKTVNVYGFYSYYQDSKGDVEKGYFWLRGSGFWLITDIQVTEGDVEVLLKKVN